MEPRGFELQPTLTGARLELRPLRPEDLEPLYKAGPDGRLRRDVIYRIARP